MPLKMPRGIAVNLIRTGPKRTSDAHVIIVKRQIKLQSRWRAGKVIFKTLIVESIVPNENTRVRLEAKRFFVRTNNGTKSSCDRIAFLILYRIHDKEWLIIIWKLQIVHISRKLILHRVEYDIARFFLRKRRTSTCYNQE